MFYLFLTLLIISPLTYYGLDQHWTLTFIEAGSAVLFLMLILQAIRRKRIFYTVPGLLPLGCYCFFVLLLLIPLPPSLLVFLSPTASEHYQNSVWLLEPGAWMPVTIFPKATLLHFFRFSSYALFFVATVQILSTAARLKKTAFILSCFGGIYAFIGLLQFFAPGKNILWVMAPWPERLSHAFGSYINGNHYAGLMEMLFPVSLTCFFLLAPKNIYGTWRDRLIDFISDPTASKHIFVGVSAAFIAVSILFSLSRGGTISLALSTLLLLGLLFYKLKTKQKSLISILLLISVLGLVGMVGWEPVTQRFGKVFNSAGEIADQRPIFWQDSLGLIADYPVLGSGPGSFIDSYEGYQTINTGDLFVGYAHNDYLELLAESGSVGFFLVACFLGSLLWQTWPIWKRRRNSASRYLYLGALCGIAAILFHSVTDFNFAIPPNGLFFFFLCGLLVASAHIRSKGSKKSELKAISSGRTLLYATFGILLFFGSGLFNGGILLARGTYNSIADLNPDQPSFEQQQENLHSIRAAAARDPLESDYRYAEAIILQSIEKSDSLSAFQGAVKLRPFNGLYLQEAGKQASLEGMTDAAQKLLLAGMQAQQSRFLPYQEYGGWLLGQQQQAEGFSILHQGLNKHPAQTERVLTQLALAQVEPLQMKPVLPDRAQSWQVYADYLAALNKEPEADLSYRKAIELSEIEEPPITKPYWSYYRYLRDRMRDSEALALMLEGIKNFPQDGGFHRNAGLLYERQGIIYRAIEEYQQALLIDPKHEWVKKRLNKLQSK